MCPGKWSDGLSPQEIALVKSKGKLTPDIAERDANAAAEECRQMLSNRPEVCGVGLARRFTDLVIRVDISPAYQQSPEPYPRHVRGWLVYVSQPTGEDRAQMAELARRARWIHHPLLRGDPLRPAELLCLWLLHWTPLRVMYGRLSRDDRSLVKRKRALSWRDDATYRDLEAATSSLRSQLLPRTEVFAVDCGKRQWEFVVGVWLCRGVPRGTVPLPRHIDGWRVIEMPTTDAALEYFHGPGRDRVLHPG